MMLFPNTARQFPGRRAGKWALFLSQNGEVGLRAGGNTSQAAVAHRSHWLSPGRCARTGPRAGVCLTPVLSHPQWHRGPKVW